MDDELDIPSLRVVDLKVELEKRGLSKSGTKRELADRLQTYIDSLKEVGPVISDGDVSMVSIVEDDEDAPLKPAKGDRRRPVFEEVVGSQKNSEDKKKETTENEKSTKKETTENEKSTKKDVSEETDDFDDAIVMSTSEMFEDDFLAESDKRSPRKSEKSLAAVKQARSPQKVAERISPVKVSPVKPVKESPPKPAKALDTVQEVPKESVTTIQPQQPEQEKPSDLGQPIKSATQDDPTIIPFRRLARSQSNQQRSQRPSWSSISKDKNSSSVVVTSQELTDIVPDIKPILESLNETEEEPKIVVENLEIFEEIYEGEDSENEPSGEVQSNGHHQEELKDTTDKPTRDLTVEASRKDLLSKKAESRSPESDAKKNDLESKKTESKLHKRKIVSNESGSRVLSIRNLRRPFTLVCLKEYLKRTGTLSESEFWINKIKSHAIVKYATVDEAEETLLAIDGVKWPQADGLLLDVKFTTEEELQAAMARGDEAPQDPVRFRDIREERETHVGLKWSRSTEEEKKQERKVKEAEPEPPKKSLDELYRKTKTLPALYWMPKC